MSWSLSVMAPLIGENLGVEVVEIDYADDGKRHRATIDGSTLEVEDTVLLEDGTPVMITGLPFPNFEVSVAKGTNGPLKAFGLEFGGVGKNGPRLAVLLVRLTLDTELQPPREHLAATFETWRRRAPCSRGSTGSRPSRPRTRRPPSCCASCGPCSPRPKRGCGPSRAGPTRRATRSSAAGRSSQPKEALLLRRKSGRTLVA